MLQSMLVATRNHGKLAEIRRIIEPYGIQIFSPDDVGLDASFDVEETGTTFAENACIKARGYALEANMPALADDSGLVVDALNGAPGVYSKRYGVDDRERIERLLRELGQQRNRRNARFVCVMCMYDPENDISLSEEGIVEGSITAEPKGTGGFGYDPIFFSTELGKTFAEAEAAEKNDVSHRGRALRALLQKFASEPAEYL